MDKAWHVPSTSPEETYRLGVRLGALLRPGHYVLLEGPLGAGKTVFVQGIGEGMGLAERVTSPTFTLVHHYGYGEGDVALVHADLYRLDDPREVDDLGLEEAGASAPLVVEWWRKAADWFPPGRLEIELRAEGESRRLLICRATDAVHGRLLAAWLGAVAGSGEEADAHPSD